MTRHKHVILSEVRTSRSEALTQSKDPYQLQSDKRRIMEFPR
jgi:Tfp pilus assembly protein FimT